MLMIHKEKEQEENKNIHSVRFCFSEENYFLNYKKTEENARNIYYYK